MRVSVRCRRRKNNKGKMMKLSPSRHHSQSRRFCRCFSNRSTIMYESPGGLGLPSSLLLSLLLVVVVIAIGIFMIIVGISTGTIMMMEVITAHGFSPALQQTTSKTTRTHVQKNRLSSSSSLPASTSTSSSPTTISATHSQQQQLSNDTTKVKKIKSTSSKRISSTDKIKQRFIDWSHNNNDDGAKTMKNSRRKKKILWVDGNNVRGKNKFEWDMDELLTLIVEELFCGVHSFDDDDIDCAIIVVWDHGHEPSIYSQTVTITSSSETTTTTYDHGDDDREDDGNKNNSKEKEVDLVVLFSGLTQRADDVLVKESKYLLQNFLLSKDDGDGDGDGDGNDEDGDIDDWSSFAFVTSDRELRFKLQRQAAAMSSASSSPFHPLLSSRSGRRGSTTKPQKRRQENNNMPMICDSRQFVDLLKHQQQQNQNRKDQSGLQQQTSTSTSSMNNGSSLLAQKTLQETQDSINELISPKTMPTAASSSSTASKTINMKFHKRQQLARSRSRRRQWRRRRGGGGGGGSGLWGGSEKTWQRCILAESLRRAYDNDNGTVGKRTSDDFNDGKNRRKSDFLLSLETLLESSRGYKVLGKDRSPSSIPSSKYNDIRGPARLDKKQRRLLQNYNKLMAEKSSSQSSSFPQSEQEEEEDKTNKDNKNQLLVLGLGRVGEEVARMALESNKFDQVIGTVRSKSKGSDTRILDDQTNENNTSGGHNKSIQSILFAPASVSDVLKQSSHVLFTIPLSSYPDPEMKLIQQMIQEWYVSSFSSSETTSPQWLGLLSTTGVYGNHDGAWVTEDDSLLCGEDSNAYLYKQLEEDWIEMSVRHQENRIVTGDADEATQPPGPRVCIFRCAGIYDSSRSALHTVYKQGHRPSPKLSSSTSDDEDSTVSKTNRIHSFDIAQSVVKSMLQTRFTLSGSNTATVGDNLQLPPYRIYNLADDLPEARSVVLDYAYQILFDHGFMNADERIGGQESEDVVDTLTRENGSLPTNSSKRRLSRRQRERKLVSNNRMKSELLSSSSEKDVGLKYPTYKEGLDYILLDPSTPWRGQE